MGSLARQRDTWAHEYGDLTGDISSVVEIQRGRLIPTAAIVEALEGLRLPSLNGPTTPGARDVDAAIRYYNCALDAVAGTLGVGREELVDVGDGQAS